MAIAPADVMKLRQKTGQGMMDCKHALEESGGDLEKAVEVLRKRGLATAEKKAVRAAAQGRVHAYIHHNGKVGVLVEVNCETDFVAKNEQFLRLVNDLCLHICAAAPIAVRRQEVPEALVQTERRILKEQAAAEGKPAAIIEKMVEGRLKKWYADRVLLEQPFVKDPLRTVQDIVAEAVAKTGENIVVRRFARFQVGEGDEA
jgi:elongation factor Ts